MRNLFVTRGLPGSGKTHTLDRMGLTDFTISADALRLMMSSPVLRPDGRMTIDNSHNNVVWSRINEILGHRMARGETVVVDATHPSEASFSEYIKLSVEHRYRIACLDFSQVPHDVVNWHNEGRQDHRRVPQAAVDRISGEMEVGAVPQSVHRIMVRSDGSHLAEARAWMDIPVLDLDRDFERVVHVGDIQGCHTALMSLLNGGLRDDTFYIFVGDACDRGDENGLVMRWLIDNAIGRPNVRFLWGNHEDHLHKEALGLDPVSTEFSDFTLPQLREAGVNRAELDGFCSHLEDMILYRHGRHKVMVTHAGLSTVPDCPWLISANQCAHGTGYYEDDVDTQFERNAPDGWAQVHGHRNHHLRPVQATSRSFNLESSVEAGGQMRGLLLDGTGFHPIEVANPVFRPFRLRRHRKMTIIPPWMNRDDPNGTIIPADVRKGLDDHPMVRKQATVTFPHVVNVAFSKKVFYDKLWDDVTVKARGMFFDHDTNEVVARFADKFWNIGEKPEVSMEALRQKLVFPVTTWVKENGFLGLLGYDRRTDSLFASSKSRAEGPFAEMFKEILDETIPSPGLRDKLRRFLRDTESCMAFEVIDPVRDPHIIEYPECKLVLLDVVRRSTEFETLPYADLERVGKQFGLEVKKKAMTFQNWESFEGWRRQAMSNMSKKIEGYVHVDANGYPTKDKLPFYSFWKLARGMKDSMIVERGGGRPARMLDAEFLATRNLEFAAPLAVSFREWCEDQSTETLRNGIISLRTEFLEAEASPRPATGMRGG